MEQLDYQKIIKICCPYGIKNIALFGSFVRGEATPDSDIDLLVEFIDPIGLLVFVRLERELSEAMGRKVDLLTDDAISPHIKESILSEKQVIYEAA